MTRDILDRAAEAVHLRHGNVRLTKVYSAFNELRAAIRAHDSFAAEKAWERCEQWIGGVSPDIPARLAKAESEIAALRRTIDLIASGQVDAVALARAEKRRWGEK